MANLNQLNLKLLGEESITLLNKTIAWTPKDKIENTYVMSSITAPKSIDFSSISSMRTMVFSGSGNYIVSITTGVSATAQTIEHETSDLFVFSPTTAMMADITNITISTTSSSSVTIEVKLYGSI